MNQIWLSTSVMMLGIMSLTGCSWSTHSNTEGTTSNARSYQESIDLGSAIEYRPKRLHGGEDRANHPCIRGSYRHVYKTTSPGLKEVWLCCVPINELLSDSFHCSGNTLLPTIYRIRGADYAKIRSCHLEHPTSNEHTLIPACIPAPFRAPDIEKKQ